MTLGFKGLKSCRFTFFRKSTNAHRDGTAINQASKRAETSAVNQPVNLVCDDNKWPHETTPMPWATEQAKAGLTLMRSPTQHGRQKLLKSGRASGYSLPPAISSSAPFPSLIPPPFPLEVGPPFPPSPSLSLLRELSQWVWAEPDSQTYFQKYFRYKIAPL